MERLLKQFTGIRLRSAHRIIWALFLYVSFALMWKLCEFQGTLLTFDVKRYKLLAVEEKEC